MDLQGLGKGIPNRFDGVILAIRDKEDVALCGLGFCGKEDRLNHIVDVTETYALVSIGRTKVDSLREEPEKGVDVSLPRAIHCRRSEDKKRKLLSVSEGYFLPHPLASPIG